MRRLLVTGGAGFIGANFVHYWLRRHPGDRLVVLDLLTYAGNPANLEPVASRPEYRFERGDICDRPLVEQLLREERIDTIVHFAAESHVDRSIATSDPFIRTNILGTHELLEAARQVWLKERSVGEHRFHHVSTDEVYGSLGPDDPPFSETTPYAPNSPYAASKAASDHLVRAFHHTHRLAVTISNCSNNYGPHQFPEKLIPVLIVNILHGRPLPIYGDGRNIRDWLHVSDHCRGIDLILTDGHPGQVYHIGGGTQVENLRLMHMLCAVAEEAFRAQGDLASSFPECPAAQGQPVAELLRFVADRPGHDRRYAVDCSKIQRELGYRAEFSLPSGLAETFDWYARNRSWWRAVGEG